MNYIDVQFMFLLFAFTIMILTTIPIKPKNKIILTIKLSRKPSSPVTKKNSASNAVENNDILSLLVIYIPV